MKNYLLIPLFITVSSGYISACATSPEDPDAANYPKEYGRSDCISELSVRDYQVLDDANLIVSGSGKRVYHVVLARRAFGLRSTWRLGFESRTGQICAGFSDVVLDEGGRLERIPLRSIRRLNPEDHEALLIRFGKKQPEAQQAPAEQEVESAGVEELD